jgi:hypothetical protein
MAVLTALGAAFFFPLRGAGFFLFVFRAAFLVRTASLPQPSCVGAGPSAVAPVLCAA